MKIILTHIQGSRNGTKSEYDSPIVRVGRDPKDCQLIFNSIEEPGVSRIHAAISFEEGIFYLEDNKSRNGTFVDAIQVQGKIAITRGSFIQFGVEGPIVQFDFDLNYKSKPAKASKTKPVPKVEPPLSQVLDDSPKITCPSCEAKCSFDAKFCRRCGCALLPNIDLSIYDNAAPDITMAPMSKEEREAQERKRIIESAALSPVFRGCAVCGSKLTGDPKFCGSCGALIHPDSSGLNEDKSLTPQPVATAYVSMDKIASEAPSANKVRKPKTKPDNPTVSDLSSEMGINQSLELEQPKSIVSPNMASVSPISAPLRPLEKTSSAIKIELPHAQRQGPLIPPNKAQEPKEAQVSQNKPTLTNAFQMLNKTFSPGYTLLLSAQALAKEGRNKLALDECERALRLDPHLPEVYQFMGQLFLSLGENTQAVEAFEKAIQMQPTFGEVYADLSQAYLLSGRYEEAAKLAKEAISVEQVNPSAFYTIGHALMEMGDYANAFEAFSRAIKLKPDCPEAHLGLANIQFRGGRVDDAIVSCRKAIKSRPDYYQAFCLLGQSFRAKKQLADAQQALKQAIKLKPDYSIAYNYLALNYRSQGNLDEAEAACYKAIALDPNLPENHNTMGLLYGERGDYSEAINEYKKALALRPNYAEAYNNVGLCYFKTNSLELAIEYFEKAITLEPQFVLARVNLALCYFKKQDKDNVKKQYDILYELDESRAAKLYQKIKSLLKS
ncbi:MAG: tetratricopeptide repeat protein [Acidobacteria bacterium]|nr:tetratricopeptide repeat protein [Acidobacteriota bacterium]